MASNVGAFATSAGSTFNAHQVVGDQPVATVWWRCATGFNLSVGRNHPCAAGTFNAFGVSRRSSVGVDARSQVVAHRTT
jgi:hypothetical protein